MHKHVPCQRATGKHSNSNTESTQNANNENRKHDKRHNYDEVVTDSPTGFLSRTLHNDYQTLFKDVRRAHNIGLAQVMTLEKVSRRELNRPQRLAATDGIRCELPGPTSTEILLPTPTNIGSRLEVHKHAQLMLERRLRGKSVRARAPWLGKKCMRPSASNVFR